MVNELSITKKQVEVVLKLLSEGNTIPFIARYRKELTGSLDEEMIRKINEVYTYQENLFQRKEDVIRLIDEKGLLTEELESAILRCTMISFKKFQMLKICMQYGILLCFVLALQHSLFHR